MWLKHIATRELCLSYYNLFHYIAFIYFWLDWTGYSVAFMFVMLRLIARRTKTFICLLKLMKIFTIWLKFNCETIAVIFQFSRLETKIDSKRIGRRYKRVEERIWNEKYSHGFYFYQIWLLQSPRVWLCQLEFKLYNTVYLWSHSYLPWMSTKIGPFDQFLFFYLAVTSHYGNIMLIWHYLHNVGWSKLDIRQIRCYIIA